MCARRRSIARLATERMSARELPASRLAALILAPQVRELAGVHSARELIDARAQRFDRRGAALGATDERCGERCFAA